MDKIFTRERAKQAGVAVVVVVVIAALVGVLSYVFYPKNNSPEAGMVEPTASGFMGEQKTPSTCSSWATAAP